MTLALDMPRTPRQPNGLKVVLFAGGGGSSYGMKMALGCDPDVAVNHDPEAVAMHQRNHPLTKHYCQNVWQVKPSQIIEDFAGRPIDILWASPDCKHFSKAKGGKPVEKHIRDLGWVVHAYARLPAHLRPLQIYLENVEEFKDWGPLIEVEGGKLMPCPLQKGLTFKRWVRELRNCGYKVEWREIRASDLGTPTIRKRLYIIARCDGLPIVWPATTHGKAEGLQPFRTAAECIDFTRHCPSIFGRKKELVRATKRRIAVGVGRYTIFHADPFLIPVTHGGDSRVWSVNEATRTMTCAPRGEIALVAPHITKFRNGAVGSGADEPMHTVTANSFIKRAGGATPLGLVETTLAPLLVKNMTNNTAKPGNQPLSTALTGYHNYLAAPVLAGCGGRAAQSPPKPGNAPMNAATAKADKILVAPYFVPRYGERPGQDPRTMPVDMPGPVIVPDANGHRMAAVYLAQHNTAKGDGVNPGRDGRLPVSTIMQSGSHQSVISSSLINMHGADRRDAPITAPTPSSCAQGTHIGEVRAVFVTKYHRDGGQHADIRDGMHTLDTKGRMGLVTVEMVPAPDISDEDRYGAWWVARFLEDEGVLPANDDVMDGPRGSMVLVKGMPMIDIGMRMLEPRELFNAQGFPVEYVISFSWTERDPTTGRFIRRTMTKTAQIRMCGNSVCPPVACAIIAANNNAPVRAAMVEAGD